MTKRSLEAMYKERCSACMELDADSEQVRQRKRGRALLARLVYEHCKLQELSEASFAKKVPIAQPTLSRWLSGERRATPENLAAVCKALQTSPEQYDDLLNLFGYSATPRPIYISYDELRRQREVERAEERRQHLHRCRFSASEDFFAKRRSGFVGRRTELKDIRQFITELTPSGGYVLITGQAGQGKSSIIAQLVAEEEPEHSASYFIRFNAGVDEQILLLQHLIASLLIAYNLEEQADVYLPQNGHQITLHNTFVELLKLLSKRGRQVTLYIDGLDQIKPNLGTGERDLSFLPEILPPGIVIVLGTRATDTLQPLRVLAQQRRYDLPELSPADFTLLLAERNIDLSRTQQSELHQALHGNAFDLSFVAGQIRQLETADVPQLLARVRANPENIFSFALDRLRRDGLWREVIQPILGCLLAALNSQPLSEEALSEIIGQHVDEVSLALLKLGDIVYAVDRRGRPVYYLAHLKLIDYLQDDKAPRGERLFTKRNIEQWHKSLATWCSARDDGMDTIWSSTSENLQEQERRIYALQHLVMHLAIARDYEALWNIIDTGEYGRAKFRYDPSMRSYAQDLELARRATLEVARDRGFVTLLPRLWKYSLLRASLTSRTDQYPESLFLALVALGRGQEAVHLSALLSEPSRRIKTLAAIGQALMARGEDEDAIILRRVSDMAESLKDDRETIRVLGEAAERLAATGWEDKARHIAVTFNNGYARDQIRTRIVEGLMAAGQWEEAHQVANPLSDDQRVDALIRLARGLESAGRRDEAQTVMVAARQAATAMGKGWLYWMLALQVKGSITIELWQEARASLASISEGSTRAIIQCRLAEELAAAGQGVEAQVMFAAARQTAESIRHEQDRATTLARLAERLAIIGRWDEAETTFAAARQAAEVIGDRWDRAYAMKMLATALVTVQRWDEARNVAAAIDDSTLRTTALSKLVEGLVEVGRLDEAREMAEPVNDPWTFSRVIGKLAVGFAASERLNEALRLTEAIHDRLERANVLSKVAIALATVDRHDDAIAAFDSARRLAEAPGQEEERTQALRRLARALVAVEQWNVARRTAEVIGTHKARSTEICILAEGLIKAGRWDEARQLVEFIDEPDHTWVLRDLTAALSEAGRWDEACRAAKAIDHSQERPWALGKVAQALAAVGKVGEAYQLVEGISERDLRADAQSMLVEGLATARLWGEARLVAIGIEAEKQSICTLSKLALKLVEVGEVDEAYGVARSIGNEEERVTTLCALVEALVGVGHWDEARRMAMAIDVEAGYPETFSEIQEKAGKGDEKAQLDQIVKALSKAKNRTDVLKGQNSPDVLSNLVRWLVTSGRSGIAHQLTEMVEKPRERVVVQTTLVEEFVTAGRWGEARDYAAGIEDERTRNSVLGTLTMALGSLLGRPLEKIIH